MSFFLFPCSPRIIFLLSFTDIRYSLYRNSEYLIVSLFQSEGTHTNVGWFCIRYYRKIITQEQTNDDDDKAYGRLLQYNMYDAN